jgi:hypothetical protein
MVSCIIGFSLLMAPIITMHPTRAEPQKTIAVGCIILGQFTVRVADQYIVV